MFKIKLIYKQIFVNSVRQMLLINHKKYCFYE